MKYWLTVYTKPRQEDTAGEHLERQGFAVYLPRILAAKRRRDRWQDRIEPLFPRYLFIEVEEGIDNLAPVRSTRGVSHLVRFGNELVPVPDTLIDGLRAMEDPDSGFYIHDADALHPGDPVTILDGPFADLQGVYQGMQGEQRALILLEVLGRLHSIYIPRHKIARSS
jgi:transcriptional antiterminator RfaH